MLGSMLGEINLIRRVFKFDTNRTPLQLEKRHVKWTPDEEQRFSVRRDKCCPPWPEHRDHPGALLAKVQEAIRRCNDV